MCVESTLRDASFRDYACVILADCTAETVGRSQVRTNHEASLYVIQAQFGWVAESPALLKAIGEAAG